MFVLSPPKYIKGDLYRGGLYYHRTKLRVDIHRHTTEHIFLLKELPDPVRANDEYYPNDDFVVQVVSSRNVDCSNDCLDEKWSLECCFSAKYAVELIQLQPVDLIKYVWFEYKSPLFEKILKGEIDVRFHNRGHLRKQL